MDERGHRMYERENGRDTVELKGKGEHRGGQGARMVTKNDT